MEIVAHICGQSEELCQYCSGVWEHALVALILVCELSVCLLFGRGSYSCSLWRGLDTIQ